MTVNFPPVKLQYCELDDEIEIIDGHHRVLACYISKKDLPYILTYSIKPKKRFCQVKDWNSYENRN